LYRPSIGIIRQNRRAQKAKGLSQKELAKLLNTSYSVIGKYERDEMQPSIEAARKIAKLVGTTVGYLLGKTEQENILKDPDMLKRLNEIEKMDQEDKKHILYTIDGLIKSVKLRNIGAL
jgi:transcriptional regulator with XRE-family HTH domain